MYVQAPSGAYLKDNRKAPLASVALYTSYHSIVHKHVKDTILTCQVIVLVGIENDLRNTDRSYQLKVIPVVECSDPVQWMVNKVQQ